MASTTSFGHISEPIVPVDQALFRAVVIQTPVPIQVPIIIDSFRRVIPTSRPEVEIPEGQVSVDLKVTPKPEVLRKRRISGLASWYCSYSQPVCRQGYGPGTYSAAAGPTLRAAMGNGNQASKNYQGRIVKVCAISCAEVKLIDWCQCYWKQSNEKLIDLYKIVWDSIGAGRGKVTVSW